jgi:hypothetical protein
MASACKRAKGGGGGVVRVGCRLVRLAFILCQTDIGLKFGDKNLQKLCFFEIDGAQRAVLGFLGLFQISGGRGWWQK